MGFRINTNIGAMNAHRNAQMTNLNLDKSLERLSSGLRINKAADDASGMAIADSLRAQAQGLGQAIRNANDGIGVVQTADGALDEYINIINTVRTKAIQAASDGQNTDSRMAIQRDINRLLEEADNIAKTTSFNGLNLLDGSYTDKKFQIGAYANETVNISISSARTTVVGMFALTTGSQVDEGNALSAGDLTVGGVDVGASTAGTDNARGQAATSAWAKMNAINSVRSQTGVDATANTTVQGDAGVAGGTISAGSVFINGIDLGDVTFSANDSTGTLVAAINRITDQTGVTASIVDGGKLKLTSEDGWDIDLSTTAAGGTVIAAADATALGMTNASVNGGAAAALEEVNAGVITLESDNAITIAGNNPGYAGFTAGTTSVANSISTADVTTYDAAQLTIKKADHALAQLDRTRSDIGSVQNQLESTIRNISVTQVNVTAAESQIRDVDFAQESANFSKYNILAQSGSYALSQANAVQQNVLRLLQ
ncbi:flagellin N-terminal helical domain-containing protein [Hydrogenimonas sp.]